MKQFWYRVAQVIWGFPQTLVGFIIFLLNVKCPHQNFHGAVCTAWKLKSSLSLGMFIFVTDDPLHFYGKKKEEATEEEFFNTIAVHEYGHTIQSLFWGPLYLLTVGLPSMLWASLPYYEKLRARKHRSYFRAYPEAQANRLGEKVTGLKSPGMI